MPRCVVCDKSFTSNSDEPAEEVTARVIKHLKTDHDFFS